MINAGISGSLALDLLGTPFLIESALPDLLDAVSAAWGAATTRPLAEPPFATYRIAETADGRVAVHGSRPSPRLADSCDSWREALGLLAVELNWVALEQYAGFAVHAGVVAGPAGSLCFPAESGDGKTTLVAACVRAGLGYVSDEALTVSYDGELEAYTKPLTMSPWTAAIAGVPGAGICVGDEWLVPAGALGGTVESDVPRVRHVVQLSRRAGGPPRLTELPRNGSVQVLLRNSFNHFRAPVPAMRLVAQIARNSRNWVLEYSDPNDAAVLLRDELAGGPLVSDVDSAALAPN